MEKLQGFTDHVMLYVKTLVKWLLAAALIGTVGGAVGSLFHLGVEYATELRTEVPALLYALPLAGVLIVALYRFLRTQGVGTNAVLDAVHQGRELPILLIPAIFLATLLTHLAGGSAGREGAALQIGGDLGEHFGKMLRMDDKDCRLATLCGMSALFSALFGTPLAAVFFALEVVSIGVLYYSGLIPCITSSLVAYAVSLRFGIEPMRFAVAAPDTGALTLPEAVRGLRIAHCYIADGGELPELDGKLLYSDSSTAWFQLDNNMSTLQNTLNALEKSGCTVTAYEDIGLTLDSRADSWLLIVRN